MNRNTTNLVSGRGYGFFTWADLFTPRQLLALTTFSDLIATAIDKVKTDYLEGGSTLPSNERALRDGGTGATAYAEAVGVYLSFVLDRCCDFSKRAWMTCKVSVCIVSGITRPPK